MDNICLAEVCCESVVRSRCSSISTYLGGASTCLRDDTDKPFEPRLVITELVKMCHCLKCLFFVAFYVVDAGFADDVGRWSRNENEVVCKSPQSQQHSRRAYPITNSKINDKTITPSTVPYGYHCHGCNCFIDFRRYSLSSYVQLLPILRHL
jgi:hypothetical protein